MQYPSLARTRTHAVQLGRDTVLDALEDLICVEERVLVGDRSVEHQRRERSG